MDQFLVSAALEYAKALFAHDHSGHDYHHTLRVTTLAGQLAEAEGADKVLCQVAAALHDADDSKLFPETHAAKGNAVSFLRGQGVSEDEIRQVVDIISAVSFSENRGRTPETLEGQVVQDADRLDAMGAVGIARTFAFGGSRGRPIYDPDLPPAKYVRTAPSINHFHEKLLLLRDMMNTEGARHLAEGRHQFMLDFLTQFYAEWKGEK